MVVAVEPAVPAGSLQLVAQQTLETPEFCSLCRADRQHAIGQPAAPSLWGVTPANELAAIATMKVSVMSAFISA